VREAEDKQPLQPGTVTFAPPDYHLLVEDASSVALSVDAPVLFSRPAIDPLFESAAAVFGAQVLALLLTGASSDGSEGVARCAPLVAAPGCNVPRRPRHR
jgi:two-component system chemotaxis response regulator CheB